MKAEQNDPSRREALAKDQLAEVLIGSEEENIRLPGEGENDRVGAARRFLREVRDREALSPKSVDDLPVDPFVGDDLHAAGRG